MTSGDGLTKKLKFIYLPLANAFSFISDGTVVIDLCLISLFLALGFY